VPAPGTVIDAATIAGTLLTLAAVSLASIPASTFRRLRK
jgi:hypothetical protein